MYFCKWVLGNGYEGLWVIILGGPYLVGSFSAYALTPKMGKKFTKKRLYIWTSLLSALPTLLMFAICFNHLDNLQSAGMIATMLIMLALFGLTTGFTIALQPVMIADSVDYLEYTCGQRRDGLFASGLTFVSKLTSGIAILISNLLLGAVDYTETINALSAEIEVASSQGLTYELNFATVYPDVTLMMFVLITIVPAIGCILQTIPIFRYEIKDDELKRMRAENEKRRLEKVA